MVRVTVVEGTPDEVRSLFPHLAVGGVASVEVEGVDEDASRVIEQARPVGREAVQRFVDEVSKWDGVYLVAGKRQAGGFAAYVRFHRRGHGAAFAYLFPRRTYVRPHLPAHEMDGARFAKVRGGKAGDGEWSRNLALSPQEAFDDAVKFTRSAYDAAGR
jgi:hypothetical protein